MPFFEQVVSLKPSDRVPPVSLTLSIEYLLQIVWLVGTLQRLHHMPIKPDAHEPCCIHKGTVEAHRPGL